ncbi:uncharacterized protein EKO05_0009592 [Ascochyta rabiei]|uniref:Uncharacterized protein n=1 Tax=Didymella rabiei TaxID=5454 RepID=A0A163CTN3_DIDRA|nr:uncharacterized protein EKO05_0009592 [Ascochyta rabiei]KZM22682.1 hypothetical protein ST47_g6282 [Ascochyta rabiei]UPX19324.1 hypothetical protein EKO05_0009592 [Ascochyta rabiei]
MEFQKGERVFLNFETGGVEKTEQETVPERTVIPAFDFVGDILEHNPASATPPVAPSFKTNSNGFPAYKKRTPRVSAFKQQRAAKEQQATAVPKAQDASSLHNAPPPRAKFEPDEERRAIDEENQRRLDAMSEEEIEEERRELMANLSPEMIRRLLMRSSIDDGSNERQRWPEEEPATSEPEPALETRHVEPEPEPATKPSTSKKVSFAAPATEDDTPVKASGTASDTATDEQAHTYTEEATGSLHFPATPQPPDLDPNDPDFLKNMHAKYFPSLAYNPSTLSWMTPIDPSDKSSPYHPSQTALDASELRFDFKGTLLAPSIAREIPSDRGLHHHAHAPEAAGYTIPELAVTARSAVPAQRCMAYQTLGRILYRLGQGEYGVERPRQETDGPVRVAQNPDADAEEDDEADEADVGHYMAAGLWQCIEDGRVIETLTEEASREKGHLTARTFAQEALWNWRRGGGRKRHAV